jgi:hypothetical protein
MRFLLSIMVAALAIPACTADPSPVPGSDAPAPAEPAVTLACWEVPEPLCEQIAAEAAARRPAGLRPVVVAEVSAQLVTLEYADGGGRHSVEYRVAADGRPEFGVWSESQVGGVRAESGPAPGPIVPYTLGHCGLSSPIDIDGAFWDPYGQVPLDNALIGESDGQFRRLGVSEAEFVTGGSRVSLRRHEGAKSLPGCD